MAVTASAHAAFQVVRLKKIIPVMAGKLTALIGMDQHLVFRITPPYRHHQGIQNKLLRHSGSHCPTNDTAREQVHNGRQIQPAFVRADIRDVGYPRVIRSVRVKLPTQVVGCNNVAFSSMMARFSVAHLSFQAFFAH